MLKILVGVKGSQQEAHTSNANVEFSRCERSKDQEDLDTIALAMKRMDSKYTIPGN